MYKNKGKEYEVYGLEHYRRFFTNLSFSKNNVFFLKKRQIMRILKRYDVILAKKLYWPDGITVGRSYWFLGEGKQKDLLLVENAICCLYPECIEAFHAVLNDVGASYANMFIMSAEIFNDYCNWLFSILSQIEPSINLVEEGYTLSESRIYGYLGEILLNVYVKSKSLRVKQKGVVNIDQPFIIRLKKFIKEIIDGIFKRNVKFR